MDHAQLQYLYARCKCLNELLMNVGWLGVFRVFSMSKVTYVQRMICFGVKRIFILQTQKDCCLFMFVLQEIPGTGKSQKNLFQDSSRNCQYLWTHTSRPLYKLKMRSTPIALVDSLRYPWWPVEHCPGWLYRQPPRALEHCRGIINHRKLPNGEESEFQRCHHVLEFRLRPNEKQQDLVVFFPKKTAGTPRATLPTSGSIAALTNVALTPVVAEKPFISMAPWR